MGCGSSQNQVSDTYHPMNSSKPLRIDEMFQSSNSLKQHNRIYLFGQTQTKRKILQLSVQQKTQEVTLRKVSERYHIPRPKIQRDTIEMMYEEAQEVIPLNLHNSTTLPPFNQMFVTALSEKVIFLCGGVDFQFWNVCAESFLYKIASQSHEEERILKLKPQKPQTNILSQKATNLKQNSSRKAFNKFQRLGFMNGARYSHMGLSIKHPNSGRNSVYVFGGFDSNKETLKSCEVYCFEKNQWQRLPDMQISRATGFCFQYLQKIYVCGGFTKEDKRSKKIQVFDLSTDKWSILNIKLHQGIEQGFITSFKPNEIFIVGANTQGGPINSIVRFNLIDETYKWDSDLIHVDSLQKALQLSGKLFLFGGNKPNICQVYDSKSQLWTQNKVETSEEMKCGELTLFSSLSKSLFVDFLPSSIRKKQPERSSDDLIIFGTDFYPIVYSYHCNDLLVSSKSISMKLRLRKHMGIVRLSANEYFLCGGIDNFQINSTKATFNYNAQTHKVQQLDKMPSKKCKFGIVKHKNHIYCIGGTTTNSKRTEIQLKDSCRYSLLTKNWGKLPELNFRRSQCELLDTQEGLLVFGGYCDGQWVQNVEFLNTDKDKPSQFIVLSAKVPVLYPFYSKLVSKHKDSKWVKVFVLNRNIHLGNFEEVYFKLNLDKTVKEDGSQQKNCRDFDDINKLQQFDSIDLIINERVKTMEREQQKHASPFERKKSPLQEEEEQMHENKGMSNRRQNLKQIKVEPISRKEQIVQFYGQKVSQQGTRMPAVQTIQIKSKKSHHQGQEAVQLQGLKHKRQSSGVGQKKVQKNQIEDQFAQNMEDIKEMSFQFQKIKLDRKQIKPNQDLPQSQPIEDKNIQQEPSQQWFESIQMLKSNAGLPVQPQNHPLIQGSLHSQESQFVETYSKTTVKGLDVMEHPNTWIKIKQTCPTLNRVIFVKNETVIKCCINLTNSNEVKINITREKYENGDLLFDSQNSKINNNKLSTHKLKQNYA